MTANYLRFWGVRGSYPVPFASHLRTGGNTSCVEVRAGDHILIIDAGTGIIPLGHALMAQHWIREAAVLLTHYHWDHISGLPFSNRHSPVAGVLSSLVRGTIKRKSKSVSPSR